MTEQIRALPMLCQASLFEFARLPLGLRYLCLADREVRTLFRRTDLLFVCLVRVVGRLVAR
jgi:hypothetical protein